MKGIRAGRGQKGNQKEGPKWVSLKVGVGKAEDCLYVNESDQTNHRHLPVKSSF